MNGEPSNQLPQQVQDDKLNRMKRYILLFNLFTGMLMLILIISFPQTTFGQIYYQNIPTFKPSLSIQGAGKKSVFATQLLVVRGGTIIDGTGAGPLKNGIVVIRNGRITTIGKAGKVRIPAGSRVIDAKGKWVIPGLVDAHVHYSQTGWFDGRPDALGPKSGDALKLYSYPKVVASLRNHPERFFKAYLCSGVTATFDVGGYPWTRALQAQGEQDPYAPHVRAAGALLSTVDFWLNLPDQKQFVYMASDSMVRAAVRSHAALGSAAIKIWYIVPRTWSHADTTHFSKLVHLAGAEADSVGLPLIVHAMGLWEAKDAIRAGARVLAHSVFDRPVDDEFLRLAREHHVIYETTLGMPEGYLNAYLNKRPDQLPYPTGCVDSATKAKLAAGLPDSLQKILSHDPGLKSYENHLKQMIDTGLVNLKRVQDSGITVAMGTDAGNPGTLHGPSVYREMDLMQQAGLTPMQVLVDATHNGALAMGMEKELGTLEPGKDGDLVILNADPLKDITNVRRIYRVVKGGRVVWPSIKH